MVDPHNPNKPTSYKAALMNNTRSVTFKADTGATGNYVRLKDALILEDKTTTTTGPQVRLPDNSIIKSTHRGHLPIPNLPPKATLSHTFSKLPSDNFAMQTAQQYSQNINSRC